MMNRNEQAHHAEMEFLRAELDTGLTLAGIALAATQENRSERNRMGARKAYDSLLHFFPRAKLQPEQTDEIQSGLEALRSKLVDLGEEI